MTIDLTTAANAIPRAEDGHVITSEYHNSLRAIVQEIVRQLGIRPDGATEAVTLAPAFITNQGSTAWRMLNGIAAADSASTTSISGFLPLQLPDGSRIQGLKVTGRLRATSAVGGFMVKLARQLLRGGTTTVLVAIPLEDVKTDASDLFAVEGTLERVGGLGATASAAALNDYRTVDNRQYKYLLIAEADAPFQLAELHSLQVEVTR